MSEPRPVPTDISGALGKVTANILAIDEALRSECAGVPVDQVVEVVRTTWSSNGIELGDDEQLWAYATSVSDGTPFMLTAE